MIKEGKRNLGGDMDCKRVESRTVVNPVRVFPYEELLAATNSFKRDGLFPEDKYDVVYSRRLRRTRQLVALKRIEGKILAGPKELQEAFSLLFQLRHPNVVRLVGYYYSISLSVVSEFMPMGTLQCHLHCSHVFPTLNWNQRMKIALGAAKGLSYLHEAKPPVIYRDLRPSKILLDKELNPKLSDFWMTKLVPDKYPFDRLYACEGYCAPEYAITGKLTTSSNVYNFGVVLMELITGREGVFEEAFRLKEVLVRDWSNPMLITQKDCEAVADPRLRGQFPTSVFCEVVQLALACVECNPEKRPHLSEVVLILTSFESQRTPPTSCLSFFKECFESSKVFSKP